MESKTRKNIKIFICFVNIIVDRSLAVEKERLERQSGIGHWSGRVGVHAPLSTRATFRWSGSRRTGRKLMSRHVL